MAFLTTQQYHIRMDTDTGGYVIATGSPLGNYTVIGPLLTDVQQVAVPSWYGLPQLFVDAAGADTYATFGNVLKRSTNALVTAITNDATISFDGGTTDHFNILAATQTLLTGLDIPAGAAFAAKNETAASAYANLAVSVW